MATQYLPFAPVTQIRTNDVVGHDGRQGPIGMLVQSAFINVWLMGPDSTVFVSHCTNVRTQTNMENFELVPVIGTFRREPKLGTRLVTATITRYRPRGRNFEQLVRATYAAQQGVDIRGDMIPVNLLITYYQPRASLDYTHPAIDYITWLNAEMYFPTIDRGIATAASSLSDETITLIGQQEYCIEGINGQLSTVSVPQQVDYPVF